MMEDGPEEGVKSKVQVVKPGLEGAKKEAGDEESLPDYAKEFLDDAAFEAEEEKKNGDQVNYEDAFLDDEQLEDQFVKDSEPKEQVGVDDNDEFDF